MCLPLLPPGSGKEGLIPVPRKQWGLTSSSEKQHVYYPRGSRENSYQGGKGRAFRGNREHFLTQQESARPERCWYG